MFSMGNLVSIRARIDNRVMEALIMLDIGLIAGTVYTKHEAQKLGAGSTRIYSKTVTILELQ